MTKTQQTKQIVAEMLKSGQPRRLAIRFNKLALIPGFAIENEIGLAIGSTFKTLEEAHDVHSAAWRKAWDTIPA